MIKKEKPSLLSNETIHKVDSNLIVDNDTGIVGTPGSFYGEHSFQGMPIIAVTLDEYLAKLQRKRNKIS